MANRETKFRLKFLFQEFDLTSGGFIIGRSPSCNLTLEDPLVSRRHARIVTLEDHAILDDLGSRNGTLVNGEPVFEDYSLAHSDKIRIGTHDLTFIEEKRRAPVKPRVTHPPLSCHHCGAPFGPDASACTACGTLLVPDDICLHCRTPAAPGALYCSRCGAPLGHDDSTIPVELGGSSAGWTNQLIDEVIEKALSVQRYEQAARLIDGQVEGFEKECQEGQPDEKKLVALSHFNLVVAKALRDSRRLSWVLNSFSILGAPMPENLLLDLEATAAGWYDVKPELRKYLEILQGTPQNRSVGAELISQLSRIVEQK